jgi:hypothetical protein
MVLVRALQVLPKIGPASNEPIWKLGVSGYELFMSFDQDGCALIDRAALPLVLAFGATARALKVANHDSELDFKVIGTGSPSIVYLVLIRPQP